MQPRRGGSTSAWLVVALIVASATSTRAASAADTGESEDNGIPTFGLPKGAQILALCLGVVLSCGCILGCYQRVRACLKACCCCCRSRRGRRVSVITSGMDTFRTRNPMEKPHETEVALRDMERGDQLTFQYFWFPGCKRNGTVEESEGIIQFHDKRDDPNIGHSRRPDEAGSLTVQTPGMLGPVDPEELHDPVYFEVKIIHLNVYIDVPPGAKGPTSPSLGQSDGELDTEVAQVAIGWAVKPYQPFEMVGDAPFSIGIKSDGFARIHRGDGTRSFKMCRPLKTNDVVGAGYERNPQDQIITFFFTLNGQRLPPVPDEDAFFLVNDVKRHHLDAMRLLGQHRGNVNEAVWSHGTASFRGPDVDDNLLVATARPTISSCGSSAVCPTLKAPFMWKAPLDFLRQNRRTSITTSGPNANIGDWRKARRASVAGNPRQVLPELGAGRSLSTGQDDETKHEDTAAQPKSTAAKNYIMNKVKRAGRRMSAPGVLLQGFAEKALSAGTTALASNVHVASKPKFHNRLSGAKGPKARRASYLAKVPPPDNPYAGLAPVAEPRGRRASTGGRQHRRTVPRGRRSSTSGVGRKKKAGRRGRRSSVS